MIDNKSQMKIAKEKVRDWIAPALLVVGCLFYYYGFYEIYPNRVQNDGAVLPWLKTTWNDENDLLHGYAVPFLFILFAYKAWLDSRKESFSRGGVGVAIALCGMVLFLLAVRTLQMRLAMIGLPFVLSGSAIYLFGWQKGRHFLFASFFWWFAIPVPGLNQMTNVLQVMVTQACYFVGSGVGMELINSGNNIHSATGEWNFDIAEGCSGVRSLMALVMIAAIYAYYTQKELWKKILLFGSALPLALFGNFCRVFTILVLAELGFEEFAANAYHDFAGLLIFFPAAIGGMLLLDRIVNPAQYKKRVKVTHVE